MCYNLCTINQDKGHLNYRSNILKIFYLSSWCLYPYDLSGETFCTPFRNLFAGIRRCSDKSLPHLKFDFKTLNQCIALATHIQDFQ
ncbi:MAG: hypothetical protein JWR54_1695 [Mucilaginibacter sp.]|nr:hypothetical protein [Mucilaginibacter sp.]